MACRIGISDLTLKACGYVPIIYYPFTRFDSTVMKITIEEKQE
jgi:hypothetical protein